MTTGAKQDYTSQRAPLCRRYRVPRLYTNMAAGGGGGRGRPWGSVGAGVCRGCGRAAPSSPRSGAAARRTGAGGTHGWQQGKGLRGPAGSWSLEQPLRLLVQGAFWNLLLKGFCLLQPPQRKGCSFSSCLQRFGAAVGVSLKLQAWAKGWVPPVVWCSGSRSQTAPWIY